MTVIKSTASNRRLIITTPDGDTEGVNVCIDTDTAGGLIQVNKADLLAALGMEPKIEWGFTLERLHTRVSRTVSKEAAEEIARVNAAHDPKVYRRIVTDWEQVS